jgi:hypothetical protein
MVSLQAGSLCAHQEMHTPTTSASEMFGSGATGKQTVEGGSNALRCDALAAIVTAIATVTRVKQ